MTGDMIMEKIQQAWEEIHSQRRTLVCSRQDELRVRQALERFPIAGLIEVLPSDDLPPGTAYVTSPGVIDWGPRGVGTQ